VKPSRILIALAGAVLAACTIGFFALLSSETVRASAILAAQRAIAAVYPPDVALIGDSLAERCSWRNLGSFPFKVVNLAKGGSVLRQIVGQADDARLMAARTVLVNGGTNDLVVDRAPVAHIAFDFEILMRALDRVPRKIVTLVPYTSNLAVNRDHDAANAAIRKIATERGAAVIDINEAVAKDRLLRPDMTTDGLHLNSRGCEAWLTAIQESLPAKGTP
jgi:lysophospholipase L1-like esterase